MVAAIASAVIASMVTLVAIKKVRCMRDHVLEIAEDSGNGPEDDRSSVASLDSNFLGRDNDGVDDVTTNDVTDDVRPEVGDIPHVRPIAARDRLTLGGIRGAPFGSSPTF